MRKTTPSHVTLTPADSIQLSPQMSRSIHEPVHHVHLHMVQRGSMWRDINRVMPLDAQRPIQKLSEHNIAVLRGQIGSMSEPEAQFYESALRQPWYLTAFSSTKILNDSLLKPDGTIHLQSFDQRRKTAVDGQATTRAAFSDISYFGATDYVYMYPEIGVSLKKRMTRSSFHDGATIIRTPFFQEATKFAMSTHGDIFDGLSVSERLNMSDQDRSALNKHLSNFEDHPMNQQNGFARTVFYKPQHIQEGTVLQVLLDMRQLPDITRNRLLADVSEDGINTLISSLCRTEVKIPQECRLADYTLHTADVD